MDTTDPGRCAASLPKHVGRALDRVALHQPVEGGAADDQVAPEADVETGQLHELRIARDQLRGLGPAGDRALVDVDDALAAKHRVGLGHADDREVALDRCTLALVVAGHADRRERLGRRGSCNGEQADGHKARSCFRRPRG